jgi:hypothetical protein
MTRIAIAGRLTITTLKDKFVRANESIEDNKGENKLMIKKAIKNMGFLDSAIDAIFYNGAKKKALTSLYNIIKLSREINLVPATDLSSSSNIQKQIKIEYLNFIKHMNSKFQKFYCKNIVENDYRKEPLSIPGFKTNEAHLLGIHNQYIQLNISEHIHTIAEKVNELHDHFSGMKVGSDRKSITDMLNKEIKNIKDGYYFY